jgi:hypothetical protein
MTGCPAKSSSSIRSNTRARKARLSPAGSRKIDSKCRSSLDPVQLQGREAAGFAEDREAVAGIGAGREDVDVMIRELGAHHVTLHGSGRPALASAAGDQCSRIPLADTRPWRRPSLRSRASCSGTGSPSARSDRHHLGCSEVQPELLQQREVLRMGVQRVKGRFGAEEDQPAGAQGVGPLIQIEGPLHVADRGQNVRFVDG